MQWQQCSLSQTWHVLSTVLSASIRATLLPADAQPELSMDDAFADMLGDVDDILFDFAASSVDPDDPLLGPPGSSSSGVAPLAPYAVSNSRR